jgi:hypothetical protein
MLVAAVLGVLCMAALLTADDKPEPGSIKVLPDSDAVRDAAGTGQLFESVHAPGFTDWREGLNGYVFADLDGNGYLDIVTITTMPFALDDSWDDVTGDIVRTRDPTDKLRMLLNFGGFRLELQELTLTGSAATPDDVSQGWRGGQMPALADFNDDGLYDLFISRQCPMVAGKLKEGRKPVGCSLFLADGKITSFRDVSRQYGALNELAYNRMVSLGDVNLDGFIDIALAADNLIRAFEGLPKSSLYVFRPKDGKFEGGVFEDIGGTELVPDFGGFHNDSTKDKAGPNIALRDIDNDGDIDLLQSYHIMLWPVAPAMIPYSPGEYRHGIFNWRNLLTETGKFQFEKVTDNGFAVEARLAFNSEEKRFEPMTDARAPALPFMYFGDVNNDAKLDAIAFGLGLPASEPVPARFWYNLGDYKFKEATEEAGLGALLGSYRDWYEFFGVEVKPVNLEQSEGKARWEIPGGWPKNMFDAPPKYADVVFADFDNDGWVDLVVMDRLETLDIETRSFLFMNRGGGTFEPKPTTWSGIDSVGLSAEPVDLNNDGLVDLVVAADPDNTGAAFDIRGFESKIYMNTGLHGARENHWLRFRFSGVSHAALIGSRVEVHEPGTGKLIGMRGIYSNHSYRSSSPYEAHFGLGKLDKVDVEVAMPGGRKVEVKGVAADRYLDLDLAKGTVNPVDFKAEASKQAGAGS